VRPLARGGDHPSGTVVADSLVRPTRELGRTALKRSRRERQFPFLTLLRVGFTKPPQSPAVLVVSYTTVSPLPLRKRRGGLFSVALSRGSPRVGVTDHPVLWSPDLPHRTCARRDRPRIETSYYGDVVAAVRRLLRDSVFHGARTPLTTRDTANTLNHD